jgi:hypothetical protein
MPPRGVEPGTKRASQYEHIKDSEKEQGAGEDRAEEIAARTVNKERARSGDARTRSCTIDARHVSSRRGAQRSGTRDQLYEEARKLGVDGRSKMNQAQLQRAVDGAKS